MVTRHSRVVFGSVPMPIEMPLLPVNLAFRPQESPETAEIVAGFCTIRLDQLLRITSPSDQKFKEPEMELKFSAALDLRIEEQLELVHCLASGLESTGQHLRRVT